MAKKAKSKIPPFVIKFVLIALSAVLVGWAVGRGAKYLLRSNDYFRIRSVTIDASLEFINKDDLKPLLGENIFAVRLQKVQSKLSNKYPQASDLKVVRRFPNQIAVIAKQRFPFVQIPVAGKAVILDDQGVVLSLEEKGDKKFPQIIGVKQHGQEVVRGLPFDGPDMAAALAIVKNFQAEKSLSSYQIESVNVENMSKVYFTLLDNPDVIVDQDKIAHGIKVLSVVLSQGQLDLKQVKYIDLRFNEPIIGKK
jgi:cell division septal protein FtsQ